MSNGLPEANQRILQTPHGSAVGASYHWKGGQYCAIHTSRGVVGCGIYDIACADEFGMAFALAKGTPENPLREPEDLYEATIVRVSEPARALNITEGMTGMEALARMLAD
ncbi:MAG: YunC family protein [Roseibacillus sp.]|nr:YunC family protein [Roseibacillus sp.]